MKSKLLIIILAVVLLGACSNRKQISADSAATIWEAAQAIRQQPQAADKAAEVIQKQALLIIEINGATYARGGLK